MNIERITLCNITSIEGEHTIDFTSEPLRSAGLFAITGDTGAGKSSILDAICLALYNQAPRLEEVQKLESEQLETAGIEKGVAKPHDTRTFLRRGATTGHAYVRFLANDGQRYEAQWRARINKKGNHDEIKHYLLHINKKGEETLLTEKKTETRREIQRLLGLDYQQFSRTVILAQNSFAAFLQAHSEQKGQLLEKLTGTEIYGQISQRIYLLSDEAKQKVRQLEAEQAGALIGRLSTEDQQEFTHRVAHLTQSLFDYERQQQHLTQLQQWYVQREAALQRVQDTTAAHNDINKHYLALRGEQQLLERYDQVQEFRNLYVQIQENRAAIEHSKEREAQNTQQSEEQQQQVNQAQQQLLIVGERRHQAENQLSLRQSDIALGHSLEGEMGSLSSSLDESERQLHTAQLLLAQRTTETEKMQLEEERIKSELEQLNLRRQSLAVHQTMFDQYQAINEKLSLYNTEIQRNDRLQKDYKTDTQNYRELAALTERTQKSLQDEHDALAALRAQRTIDIQAIEDLDANTLHRSHTELQRRLTLLSEARRQWQRLVVNYESTAQLRADIERRSRQLDQRRIDQQRCNSEQEQLSKRYLQLSRAYILSQSEDIRALRQQLQEGVPCPVCGSAHHPLHTEIEQELGEKQSQLKRDYHEIQTLHSAKERELQAINLEISAAEARLTTDRESFAKQLTEQHRMEDEWQDFASLDASFVECNASVNRDARTTTIDMLLDSSTQQLEVLEKNIARYELHHSRIHEVSKRIDAIDTRVQEQQQQYTDQRARLTVLHDRIDLIHRHIDESNQRIEQLYKTLDDLLTMSGWRDDDIEHFSKRFAEVYAEWNTLNTKLQRTERTQEHLAIQLRNQQNARQETLNALTAEREKRDRLRETLAEKREQLQRIFGEETPSALAERLQRNIVETTALFNKVNQAYNEHLLQLQSLRGQHENLVAARHAQEEQLRERSTLLDQAIARFNLSHTPLRTSELDQLLTDSRDWNALRQQLSAIKEQLNLATQSKTEAEQAYLQVERATTRPSEHDEDKPEALEARLIELQSALEATRSERDSLQERLNLHATCLQNAAAIEATIAAAREDATEWERLRVLFGSAEGKRLRDIAQSYTFSLLVDHANYHLRQLSPRYELEVLRGTLTLQVVDHDMLDEKRFVSSLSGGETFVVSLSLALGLASLSGTMLNIGSLFIDEGFGNLDEASLSLVLNTLSTLETQQGRKVGVVSHTEQIRHQIMPQIQLCKHAGSGRSTINIVG